MINTEVRTVNIKKYTERGLRSLIGLIKSELRTGDDDKIYLKDLKVLLKLATDMWEVKMFGATGEELSKHKPEGYIDYFDKKYDEYFKSKCNAAKKGGNK